MKSKKITTVKPLGYPVTLLAGQGSPGIEPIRNSYYVRPIKKNPKDLLKPGDKVHFMDQILTLKNQDPRFLSWEFEEINISPVEYSNQVPPVKVKKEEVVIDQAEINENLSKYSTAQIEEYLGMIGYSLIETIDLEALESTSLNHPG